MPHYLDNCFNGTVVPANAYNKRVSVCFVLFVVLEKKESGLRDEHFFLYLGWINDLFVESARNFAQQNAVAARGHCQL